MSYIGLNKKIYIENYTMNRYFLVIENKNRYLINDSSFQILTRLNGEYTYEELLHDLVDYYKDDYENIRQIVDEFLAELQFNYNLKIDLLENKKKRKIAVKGKIDYYPQAASVELTERCNLKCLHCYGCFGKKTAQEMDFKTLKKILLDLKDIGVKTLELTGGDVSTYSKLGDVIKFALSLGFMKINILSNGVILKQEILDLIIKNKERIEVQIDLHSLDDEYLFWFTKAKNTLDVIKAKIEYLNNHGVEMRIATIVTSKNLHELQDIADWLGKRKIRWGIGLVEKLGRATLPIEELYLRESQFLQFKKMVEMIMIKYPGMVSIIDYQPNDCNCGALTTHVVINTKGNIKLCTMDSGEYFNNKMGNCVQISVKDLYDKNIDFVMKLTNYELPDEGSDECRNCRDFYGCSHCMLRNFINMKERNFQCKWYKNHVPQEVKTYMFAEV